MLNNSRPVPISSTPWCRVDLHIEGPGQGPAPPTEAPEGPLEIGQLSSMRELGEA